MHVHRTILILGAVFCAFVGGVAGRFAVGGETAPEELPASADASPIVPGRSGKDAIARTIIRQELPDASPVEQEIWLEEVRDMSPDKIRDLLRLRRLFGSQQPFTTSETPQPTLIPETPPEQSEPPVPMPLLEPDRYSPALRPGEGRFEFRDEVAARFQPTLDALRTARNVILNNIANADTTGFKRSRAVFADRPYERAEASGRQDSEGRPTPAGIAVGLGAEVVATQVDHTPGRLQKTGRRFDLAIAGDGFFQIQDGDEILYTRCGSFTLDTDGRLMLVNSKRGRLLEPNVLVPADSTSVHISADGVVSVRRAESEETERFGQIDLARFVNPAGLEQRGGNLFAETEASLPPQVGNPGTAGRGKLRQGYLETSNVNLESELARLATLEKQWQALSPAPPLRPPAGIAHGKRAN